ncbi:pirin family protein [Nocardia sp. NPDC006630]|uniref:pirin family protein n=1 Tax=Nocardia sp. NPDC006630 TaxID=3157181 RepID=UPI0033AD8118
MTTTHSLPSRGIESVTDRTLIGADSQVDKKAIVLPPGDPSATDPFLALMEDWFSTVGFDWHPHRGIETITYVLDGELQHRDNRGGHGVLAAGDVQWMTAGRGLLHAETAFEGRQVHTLQLWLNLPAADKLVEPGYQDLRAAAMPLRTGPGYVVKVFSGRSGDVVGPARNHVPVTMIDATVDPGATVEQEIPSHQEGFAYILRGNGEFGRDTAHSGQAVHLEPSPGEPTALQVRNTGAEPLHFLLWTGVPLHEPVAMGGPFVMNTRAELEQAVRDYQAGEFGPMPK